MYEKKLVKISVRKNFGVVKNSFGQFHSTFIKKVLKKITVYISRSAHRTVNTQFYESRIFCLFTFWVFYPDKSFIACTSRTSDNLIDELNQIIVSGLVAWYLKSINILGLKQNMKNFMKKIRGFWQTSIRFWIFLIYLITTVNLEFVNTDSTTNSESMNLNFTKLEQILWLFVLFVYYWFFW